MIEDRKRSVKEVEVKISRFVIFIGISILLGAIFTEVIRNDIEIIVNYLQTVENLPFYYTFLSPVLIIVGLNFHKVQKDQKLLGRYKQRLRNSKNLKSRVFYSVKYEYSKFKNTIKNIGLYVLLLSFCILAVSEPIFYKEIVLGYKNYSIIMHSTILFIILCITWNCLEILKIHIENSVPDSTDRLSITITIIATVVSIIALLK